MLAELPPIDVLVLGMGEDGHTASLFPDSPNTKQRSTRVVRGAACRCRRRAYRASA